MMGQSYNFLEGIAKLIRVQIRACFAGFGFFANCLRPSGYVSLRKTDQALRSSNLLLRSSFATPSLKWVLLAWASCYAGIEDHYKPIDFKGTSRGPQGIDFVYMINLDQRPERWKNATEQLAKYDIFPHRYPGIYGWTIPPDVLNDMALKYEHGMWRGSECVMFFSPTGDGTPQFIWLDASSYGKGVFSGWTVKGTIGCSLSHLSILKDAYDSGYETVWILEDDIRVLQNPHLLTERIQELDALVGKDGWDVLYTDCDALVVNKDQDIASQIPMMWRPDMPFRDVRFLAEHYDISDHLKKIGSRMRAHSIVYRRCGIKKILDFYRENNNFLPYDQELALIPDIQTYVVKDDIVSVHEVTTDTRYKNFN